LLITFSDNSVHDAGIVNGIQGLDIINGAVNNVGHLILTLSDSTLIDAGLVQGPQGIQGIQGVQGVQGPLGPQGASGNDSISGTPKGLYNVATNSPTLSNGGGGGVLGDTYTVSVAGTMTIDGVGALAVGNRIQNTGTAWVPILTPQGAQVFSQIAVGPTGSLMTVQAGLYPVSYVDNQGFVCVKIDNTGKMSVGLLTANTLSAVSLSASNLSAASFSAALAAVTMLQLGASGNPLTVQAGSGNLNFRDAAGYISALFDSTGALKVGNLQALSGTITAKLLAGASVNTLTIGTSGAFDFCIRDQVGFVLFGVKNGQVVGAGSSSGGGGSTVPVPSYNFDSTTHFSALVGIKRLRLMVGDGQSLMQGSDFYFGSASPNYNPAYANFTDALVNPNPAFASNCFMLNSTSGGSPRFYNKVATGIVPLNEVIEGAYGQETRASAMLFSAQQMLGALAIPDTSEYMGISIHARAGTALENLGRGTASYSSYQASLQAWLKYGLANGFQEVVLDGIIQHEGQANVDLVSSGQNFAYAREQYKVNMVGKYWKMCEDAKRILGAGSYYRDPIFYVSGCSHVTASSLSPFEQPIVQALNDLRTLLPAFRMVGPDYQWPRQPQNGTGPAIPFAGEHPTCIGYTHAGVDGAIAYMQEEFGTGWSDMHVIDAGWVANNQFFLRINVPLGGVPVLDTSETLVATVANVTTGALAIAGYYGILFDDASGSPPTITASTIGSGTNTCDITFTLSAPPAGYGNCRVAVGCARSGGTSGSGDGPILGARTAFRGSVGFASSYSDGTTQYPWLSQGIYSISRPQ
jgi:hypothetical protein